MITEEDLEDAVQGLIDVLKMFDQRAPNFRENVQGLLDSIRDEVLSPPPVLRLNRYDPEDAEE